MNTTAADIYQPEVFAFVPSYNHAPFVEKCLKSIVRQTLAPKKLLVIDDGSKDDSAKIIEKVLKTCPFDAELIVRENRGLCATLNQGLALSSGKYFAYLGSDDLWLPEFLAERAKLLDGRETAILGYGHAFTIDAEENIIDSSSEWGQFPDGNPRPMLWRGSAPFSPTVFYRLTALKNLRWNENAKLEDYDFYLRLSEKGEFAFDPQTLSAWRQHGTNTSHDWQFMLNEVLEAQHRNIADKNNLAKMQSATELSYTENLARSGRKKQAFSLLVKNWQNADSVMFIAKSFLRIMLPMAVLRRVRKVARHRMTLRYGKVQI